MPAWLASALSLLRTATIGGPGRALTTGASTALVLDGGGLGELPIVGGLFGEDKPKRRRRRRALTASDKADIAFVAGVISKAAADRFALVIATRAG